jgi:hypothetical protein
VLFLDFPLLLGMWRQVPVAPELREEGRWTSAVLQRSQCAERVFGAQREHRAEGVGIDTHASKLVQQQLEGLLVSHRRHREGAMGYTATSL